MPSRPVYGLDIETDTTIDGLDPQVGRILAVAVADTEGEAVFTGPEPTLLAAVDAHLADLDAGVIVTWNGARFDLPYLATRSARLGCPLGLELVPDDRHTSHHPPLPGHLGGYRARWHGHAHLDAYALYRGDLGPAVRVPCSLKAVAALAGLAPVEVDAAQIHALDAHTLATYVASDAACARHLALRRWATASLAVDSLDPVAAR
jgi:DNA polymerase elongation subunit (family B)